MFFTETVNKLLELNITKTLTKTEFMKIIKMSKSTNIVVRLLTNDVSSYLRSDNVLYPHHISTFINLIDNGVKIDLNTIPLNLKTHVDYEMVIGYPQLHKLMFIGYKNTGYKLLDLWKMTNEKPKFIREQFLIHLFSEVEQDEEYQECIEHMRHERLSNEEHSLIRDTTNIFDCNYNVACLLVTGGLSDLAMPTFQLYNEILYYIDTYDVIKDNFDVEFIEKYYKTFPTQQMKHINSVEMFTTVLNNLEEPSELVDFIFDYENLQEYIILSSDETITKIFDLICVYYPNGEDMLTKFVNLIKNHNRMNTLLKLYFDNVKVARLDSINYHYNTEVDVSNVFKYTYNVETKDELDKLIEINKSHGLLDKVDLIAVTDEVLSYSFKLGHKILLEKIMSNLIENNLIANHFETLLKNKIVLNELEHKILSTVSTLWECIAIYELFKVRTNYHAVGAKNMLPRQMSNWKIYSNSLIECADNRDNLYRFIAYQFDDIDYKSDIIDILPTVKQHKKPAFYAVQIFTECLHENVERYSQTQIATAINLIVEDLIQIGFNNSSKKTVKIIFENYLQHLTSVHSFRFSQLLEKHEFDTDMI